MIIEAKNIQSRPDFFSAKKGKMDSTVMFINSSIKNAQYYALFEVHFFDYYRSSGGMSNTVYINDIMVSPHERVPQGDIYFGSNGKFYQKK